MAVVIGLLGLYVALLTAIAWFSLHPVRIPLFFSPGALGAPQIDWEIQSGELRLRAWWVPSDRSDVVAILSHGYLMNRAELAPLAHSLWEAGVSCVLLDLRAHGRSQGRKCTLGVDEAADVLAAVAAVKAQRPSAKIVLIGSSMGSAASAFAAAQVSGIADALILDSCYSKLSNAILGWWRLFGGVVLERILWPTAWIAAPMAGFDPFKVDVADSLAKIGGTPVLLIHGLEDGLALPSEAQRNADACSGEAELVWMPGCAHSEARWQRPGVYLDAVLAFLRRHDLLPCEQSSAARTS